MRKEMVLGFMFNFASDNIRVALIRKLKPEWQFGKLNGIGGKVEPGELPIVAMVREFQEETGYRTSPMDWKPFFRMLGPDWAVTCFAACGPLEKLERTTDEEVVIRRVACLGGQCDLIPNLHWLVPLALDHIQNGNPKLSFAVYS